MSEMQDYVDASIGINDKIRSVTHSLEVAIKYHSLKTFPVGLPFESPEVQAHSVVRNSVTIDDWWVIHDDLDEAWSVKKLLWQDVSLDPDPEAVSRLDEAIKTVDNFVTCVTEEDRHFVLRMPYRKEGRMELLQKNLFFLKLRIRRFFCSKTHKSNLFFDVEEREDGLLYVRPSGRPRKLSQTINPL